MTTISANTLFHFTNSANNIIQIIKEGFSPRFCLEEFGPEYIMANAEKKEYAVPMSCFCDLPLSKIEEHLNFYGSYGIGLSKEWGQNNGLTPLNYVHEKSIQLKYTRHLGKLIMDYVKTDYEIKAHGADPILHFFELTSFYKSYEGKMWRIDKYLDKRFYDEREWRYVPFLNSDIKDYRLSKEEFLNEIKRAAANDAIAKSSKLSFKYSDIKYLIVNKESEMISLSDALDSMIGIFQPTEIKVLKTKIISSEQIKEDF